MVLFQEYEVTVLILGLVGLMMLIQFLIADALGLIRKKKPGYPVDPDHGNAIFRAVRAYENTNESVAIFILLALFAMFSGANASYLNIFAVVYFSSRVLHMLCYYANFKLARSASFVVVLLGLLGMCAIGFSAWV